MQNIWSAGQDGLLSFLAERDAKKRLTEDRARRDRLDQESFSDRQRQREIQEGQLKSIDEDRQERRRLAEEKRAEEASKAKREEIDAEQMGVLLDEYTAALTAGDQARARAVGTQILTRGGKLAPEPRAPQRPTIVSPGATVLGPDNKPIFTAPRAPERPSAAERDNPSLPRGTKAWIESIAQRGVPLEQARTELSKGWGQQRAAHPNAELGAAADYLMKLYPQVPDELATPRGPLGGEPEAAPEKPAAASTHEDLMASVPNGKRVKFSDGSVWEKAADGSVRRVQ